MEIMDNVFDPPSSSVLARPKPKKKMWRVFYYLLLGFMSFSVFLYLTFPYALIKEGVVSFVSDKLSKDMGVDMRVNIGSLRPYWFTGIVLEDLTITNTRDSSAYTKFNLLTVRLQLLPLLIARAKVSMYLSQGTGFLKAQASFPITDLISGNPVLKNADIALNNFPVDAFLNQALSLAKNNNSNDPSMALLGPLISVTSAGGKITGAIKLSSVDGLKGNIDVNISDMYLHIADNVWQIPRQAFSKAHVQAILDKGAISFGNDTAFLAPDIDFTLGGRLSPSGRGDSLEANLNIKLAMRGRIQQNIGNLVPAFLKCVQPLKENTIDKDNKESVLVARLIGSLSNMTCEQ